MSDFTPTLVFPNQKSKYYYALAIVLITIAVALIYLVMTEAISRSVIWNPAFIMCGSLSIALGSGLAIAQARAQENKVHPTNEAIERKLSQIAESSYESVSLPGRVEPFQN